MSSLTQALSIALTGLQTSTSLISMASNNISNAQTPGFTAKSADLTSVDYGSNFGGVKLAEYSRANNSALTTNYNQATTAASYSTTQNNYMKQIQTILGSTSANPALSADVANFSAAWSQYTSDPSSIQQEAVVSAGRTLTQDVQAAGTQAATLATQVQSDITNNIASLNSDLQQITAINKSIQAATTSNQPVVTLQDQLDTLTNKVAAYLNVSVQSRPNGQIALYTPGGQLLVDGPTAQQFSWNGSTITDTNGTDVTSALNGGSLQAGVDFVSTSSSAAASAVPGVGTIAKFQAQLSKLVDAFTASSTGSTSAFASAYSAAVTSSTAVGATQAGTSVASTFFTVSNGTNGQPDTGTFAVNSALIAGTSNLPQANIQAIASSFNSTANYTASGLSAPGVTYAGLTSAILTGFQQTANIVNAQSTTASSQQTYYQQTLSNSTGVNIDTELANLVSYQNSFAASAHVISTVNQMLTTLMGIIQ